MDWIRTRRWAVIVTAVATALAVNLVIYAVGRAAGGGFSYTQGGKRIPVDATAVTLLSTLPMATGLILVALIAPRWRAFVRVAMAAAPIFALATIALVTIPADFDTTSTIFLAAMHLATIPISLTAIQSLTRTTSVYGRPLSG